MARESVGISAGQILDTLYKKVSSQNMDSNVRVIKESKRRVYLPVGLAEQTMIDVDTTFHELVCETFPEFALSDDEAAFLRKIETLSDVELHKMSQLITSLQNPWWTEYNGNNNIRVHERVQEVAYRRIGTHKRVSKSMYPVLASFDTLRFIYVIPTDSIPALAKELDAPYSVFTNMSPIIPYYSRNKNADKVFCDFKLLSEELRVIPESYVDVVLARGGKSKWQK